MIWKSTGLFCFLYSCSFFTHLYPVLVWAFRQKSCYTFLFPANLKSFFCSFETQGFRRCCGLGLDLSSHRAAHLGCLAQSSSSWSKWPSVTRVVQRPFSKLLPSHQDWAKVLRSCLLVFEIQAGESGSKQPQYHHTGMFVACTHVTILAYLVLHCFYAMRLKMYSFSEVQHWNHIDTFC